MTIAMYSTNTHNIALISADLDTYSYGSYSLILILQKIHELEFFFENYLGGELYYIQHIHNLNVARADLVNENFIKNFHLVNYLWSK